MVVELDAYDKRLLFELDRYARRPETQLAKIVGKSKESVRYRIQQLKEKGVLVRFHAWIDPTRLGYHTYKMYLKLANIPQEKRALIDYLCADPRTFWVGIADGAWDMGCTFFMKTNAEFYEFLNGLLARFEKLIIRKHTGVVVTGYVCRKNFLVQKPVYDVITLFEKVEERTLDVADSIILKELYLDGRTSLVQLGERARISVDAVRSRMKKLEEEKIIAQYRAAIDWGALGLDLYKTFLFLRSMSPERERALIEYLTREPCVIHFVSQISPWDFELEIVVQNHREYNNLIDRLTQHFSDIIVDVESAVIYEDYIFPAKKMVFEK